MTRRVVTERRGAVLVITLDRPEARNAVDAAMSQAVAEAVDLLDADATLGAGVLTGAGGTFCAGMDLKAFARGELPEVAGRGFAGLTEAPPAKPLVAAVEGWALAGGFELVLACDLVVASATASFGLPEVTRGLIAGSGGLLRLPERLPRSVAAELALTGVPLPATEAHRLGLVNRLTPTGGALDAAVELAGTIAELSPTAVAATKRVLDEGATWSPAERWPAMHRILAEVLASPDAAEGAAAFAERREPRWPSRSAP